MQKVKTAILRWLLLHMVYRHLIAKFDVTSSYKNRDPDGQTNRQTDKPNKNSALVLFNLVTSLWVLYMNPKNIETFLLVHKPVHKQIEFSF